jgi:hypothetical protein
MINSPDRREVQTTLEEFMEQLVEGKDLGLEEDDVRAQLAARYGLTVAAFTKMLFEQATEEQRKGTKGLTKFLAKWRKQMSAGTPERSQSSQSPWSVVGSPAEGTPSGVGTERSFPQNSPGDREEAERETPSTRTFAVIPAPGIYGQDRKAGTGGGTSEPIAEIAKAIQQQTTELASLVKAQNESSNVPNGTVKGLSKLSEFSCYVHADNTRLKLELENMERALLQLFCLHKQEPLRSCEQQVSGRRGRRGLL